MELKVLFAAILCFLLVDNVVSWGYSGKKGPSNWYKDYPACNGQRQSPIQLLESGSKYMSFPTFTFNGYDTKKTGDMFNIKNNGHTLQITITNYTGMSVQGFGKTFRPWQIHFHWGVNNSVGSEHTLKYNSNHLHPAEMHFVHVNTAYKDVSEALTKFDGLMVFGTIFELDPAGTNSSFIAKFQNHLKAINLGETNTSMSAFPLNDAFMVSKDKFFHYNGSLTTPPCSEAVQWVVFTGETKMSAAQMKELRELRHDKTVKPANETEYLNNNYRPIQARNSRNIYRSFSGKTSGVSMISASYTALVMFIAAFFLTKA